MFEYCKASFKFTIVIFEARSLLCVYENLTSKSELFTYIVLTKETNKRKFKEHAKIYESELEAYVYSFPGRIETSFPN